MEILPIGNMLNVSGIQQKMMLLMEEMQGFSPPPISPEIFFSGLLKYPETQEIYVAIDRTTSTILGICSVVVEQSVFKKQLLITDLYVVRHMRRHKIGTMLLTHAKKFAKQHNCEKISVCILRKNTGPEYEEFFGFHQFHTVIPQHNYTILIRK